MRSPDQTLIEEYRPVGGLACLDFVNTVDWRGAERPHELLVDAAAVDAWIALALNGPPLALTSAEVVRLTTFRECLYRLITDGGGAGDLTALNAALAGAGTRERVVMAETGFQWAREPTATLDGLMARLARSTADLLVDPTRRARVKACGDDRCGWLFLDSSRAGNRRWCSMATCGNRDKARAHYRRHKRERPLQPREPRNISSKFLDF
jgi:predicted RNA-binding Zn ribbon-like protein